MRISDWSSSVCSSDLLSQAANVILQDGDELEFTADKRLGSITVRVEGEHESPQEYVLPYGTHLGDLLSKISYSERSARTNLQLFRQSVKERQRALLRSEEHTSELQSLMSIPYAVFCLKKTNTKSY